jgi:hypothetical protein
MKRRSFIHNSMLGATALAISPLITSFTKPKDLKISLAQWSLHRAFWDNKLDPADFASIARDTYGIDAVEYVNGFYTDSAEDDNFWNKMKERSELAGVKNLVIMVDDEGDLGTSDPTQRK